MTNTKTKSAIILAFTLIIGMILGFFVNSMMVRSRFEKFTKMRKPGGVEEMILEQLNPTEEQRPVIKELLSKFKVRMDGLRQKSFNDLNNLRDSLFSELKPILTEEQFKGMNESFFNPNKRFRPSRDERWRPEDGGPPSPHDMPPPDMERAQEKPIPQANEGQ